MIWETVHITVEPDKREEFIGVYRKAWKEAAFEGSHGGKVMRAMENPARVDVLIEWDSLAAHRQHRGSDRQNHFRATIHPYMTEPSKIEHFEFEELE